MRTKEEIDKLVEDNIKLVGYVINKKFSISRVLKELKNSYENQDEKLSKIS